MHEVEMIKVSDYIAKCLAGLGLRHVFMVTGGGAMHLNDSFARVVPFEIMFNHHEQAAAIAAEGLYRASGKIGVVNVTTGPGGLNALTGVLGQWTDSIPVIYISGQVKSTTTIDACQHLPLRQLGDQEVDIISVVRPLVKYAVQIKDPLQVRVEIEKAFYIATSGRMGPVWIDVPMDVQGSMIDPEGLPGFVPQFEERAPVAFCKIWERLELAERPLVVAGHGIRLAGQETSLYTLLRRLRIPVVTTFNGFDLIPEEHPSYCGRIGTLGTRGGNFALQNSDLVIFLGTRNNIRQVSYNWEGFANRAYKIVVDIDHAELNKPTCVPDMMIEADLRTFMPEMINSLGMFKGRDWSKWLEQARSSHLAFPVVKSSLRISTERIDPYRFFNALTSALTEDSVVVAGNGTACVVLFQAGIVKAGQRQFWNSGCASMGYDLPAALGAAFGVGRDVWCIAGDGSLQMNIQELATLSQMRLPVKLIYLENGGYASIRQTQSNFFGSNYGCGKNNGLAFPEMEKLAEAYGIPFIRTTSIDRVPEDQARVQAFEGPVIWEVSLDCEYIFEPKVASEKMPDGRIVSKPLQDMFPFLPREEYNRHYLS